MVFYYIIYIVVQHHRGIDDITIFVVSYGMYTIVYKFFEMVA